MPQIIPCPHCGASLNVPDNLLGKQVRCSNKTCGQVFLAQVSAPSPPPPMQSAGGDEEFDYRQRQPMKNEPGIGLQLGMGIPSLVLGIIAAGLAFIPCCGNFIAFAPIALGLIFGIIGVVVALVNKKGLAFPLVGAIVNVVAIAIVVVVLVAQFAFVGVVGTQAAAERLRKEKHNKSNLEKIGKAMLAYHKANGRFPPAGGKDGNLSWRVEILPFLGEKELYSKFRLNEKWDSPHNEKLLDRMPAVFAPPQGVNAPSGCTFYQVLVGPDGPFTGPQGPTLGQIQDGTSRTFMVVEGRNSVEWTSPDNIPFNRFKRAPELGSEIFADYSVVMFDGRAYTIETHSAIDRRKWMTYDAGDRARTPR